MSKKNYQQTTSPIPFDNDPKLLRRINQCAKFHRVGINWFAKCPFCSDTGSHLCVPTGLERFICFRCNINGTMDQFFLKFNNIEIVIPTQMKIE